MSKIFQYFKKLPLDQQNVFWDYIFGFVTYEKAYEKLERKDDLEQVISPNFCRKEPVQHLQSRFLLWFLDKLKEYRLQCDSSKKKKGCTIFQQIDNQQFDLLSKNNYKIGFISLNVLLDTKYFKSTFLQTIGNQAKNTPKKMDLPETSFLKDKKVEHDFSKNTLDGVSKLQVDSSILKNGVGLKISPVFLTQDFQNKYLYYLRDLYNEDMAFFLYVQNNYTLMCQAFFEFFKRYIRFAAKNSVQFSRILKKEDKQATQRIKSLWKEQLKFHSVINSENGSYSYIMEKILHRYHSEIENIHHVDGKIVLRMEYFPLPSFFWNCAEKNNWQFSLVLESFSRDMGFFYYVTNYYLPDEEDNYNPFPNESDEE